MFIYYFSLNNINLKINNITFNFTFFALNKVKRYIKVAVWQVLKTNKISWCEDIKRILV